MLTAMSHAGRTTRKEVRQSIVVGRLTGTGAGFCVRDENGRKRWREVEALGPDLMLTDMNGLYGQPFLAEQVRQKILQYENRDFSG